jgi:hypothetical protein
MVRVAENASRRERTLEALSRAVNRRKAALRKLAAGRPAAVDERHARKLLKQAQRRKRKLEGDIARHAGRKPESA